MTGTTTEEQRLFLVPTGLINLVPDEMLTAFAAGYGLGTDAVAVGGDSLTPSD